MAQIQKKTAADVGDQTSHSVVFNSPPTQGNMMILCIASNVFIVTPPSGWTNAVTQSDFLACYVYYKIAGPGESSTVSFTSTAGCAAMIAFEYSSLSSIDQTANAIGQGAAGTISTGTTSTTTSANEIAFAVATFRLGDGATSVSSWSNSFTTEGNASSLGAGDADVYIDVATKTLVATGTVTSTATLNTTAGADNVGAVATFVVSSPVILAWLRA